MTEKTIERFRDIFGGLKEIGDRLLVDLGDEKALLERLRHKPRVLVVGEFNVGKSSLINAALGEVLLPVGVTPTTSLITVLEKGPYQLRLKPLGEKDTVNIEPGKPQLTGYGIPDDFFDWEAFKRMMTDPKNIDRIEKVFMNNPAVPDSIVLIDTPGINDLSKARSELLYGLIPTADIIIFVISALKPFSESERIFLEERLLAGDLKKILFVVNRLDEVDAAEREELLSETGKSITTALNASYDRINKALKQTLFPPITEVPLFGASAHETTPISGTAPSRGIGFDLPIADSARTKGFQNRSLWNHVLNVATKERKREVELSLLHFLRRGALRLQRAVESLAGSDSSSRATMSARLVENAAILGKMKDLMQSSEEKIQSTENELKQTIHGEIDKALDDLLKAFRLQRNPGVVNQRLKQLYEYIVARMKASLEDLYAQLGNDFDAVLDDKRFVEERELHVEYDLSDVPQKIVSSLSFAYLAAIFFGISVGLFAGAAYFASQVISNKRSLKEYFMNATVSEETLAGVKADLLAKTDNEIEYAIDFVRQSIVQRIDVIQRDVRNITYAMTQSGAAEIEKSRGRLEALQARINGFLADRTE